MQSLAEQIVVDIIRNEMGLASDQVFIRDMNVKIPDDTRLYVVVGMIDAVTYSASEPYLREEIIGSDVTVLEVQEMQMGENIQIDILSRSREAIMKKNEVTMSLNSFYAKQKQEEHNFKIARLPRSVVNSSYAEGGSQLNRFSITHMCLTWHRKIKDLSGNDYYDKFKTRVDDERTIGTEHGIIEFEITPDTPEPPIVP